MKIIIKKNDGKFITQQSHLIYICNALKFEVDREFESFLQQLE
jgi:hypothetical protein